VQIEIFLRAAATFLRGSKISRARPAKILCRSQIFLASLQKIFSLFLSTEAESFFANSREPLNFCFARLAKFPGLAEI
jgi:hypothetical protein